MEARVQLSGGYRWLAFTIARRSLIAGGPGTPGLTESGDDLRLKGELAQPHARSPGRLRPTLIPLS
jgi:hypothetical protein